MILDTLGWIYYKQGDKDQALGLLERAISKAPEHPVLNYHLGMVLYEAGRSDEAKEKLEKALAGNEPFPGRGEAEKTLHRI
jgi:tetratricopeptide (TPR) repeat protein